MKKLPVSDEKIKEIARDNDVEIVENKQKIAKLLSENLLTVCIGPITAKVLEKYGIDHIYPDTYTVPDMMELLFKTLDRC